MQWVEHLRAEDGDEWVPMEYFLQQLLASEPKSDFRALCLRNIVDMLTTASSTFPINGNYSGPNIDQMSPILHWLLRAGCDVDELESFWPDKFEKESHTLWRQRDYENNFPIDLACQFGCPQVIAKVIEKMKQDLISF